MSSLSIPTSAEFRTYDFGDDSVPIRVTTDENGDPLWNAGDVCRAIGINNSRQALARLDDDEKGVITADTPGGRQPVGVVTEGGLYSLLMTSRTEKAKPFRKWVTSVVLPSIRQTGRYDVRQGDREVEAKLDADPTAQTLRALLDVRREQIRLDGEQRALFAVVAETQATADEAKRIADATAATLVGRTGHVSALGYANNQGYRISRDGLAAIGKRLCREARARGIEPPKTSDERYGSVKIYPETFVREFDAVFRRAAGLGG